MKRIEFWYWTLRQDATGRVGRSICRLTEAEALRRDPDARRVPDSCEVRVLPKHPDEYVPRLALTAGRHAGASMGR